MYVVLILGFGLTALAIAVPLANGGLIFLAQGWLSIKFPSASLCWISKRLYSTADRGFGRAVAGSPLAYL